MSNPFPSEAWLKAFHESLNEDERYARVAENWEGDVLFVVETGSGDDEVVYLYMDLWHGKCRRAAYYEKGEGDPPQPKFTLTATTDRYRSILTGELDPLQAMVTRKLKVRGNMAYLLRNVPVVLDFVRCASEVGIEGD